jgi:hypothetical protein
MSRPKVDESAFRHYMRVRMGATGPTGRLLRCARRNGGGHYWKVHLDSGEWVWPDGLVIDGPGDRVAVCAECELPFMTKGDEPLCAYCDEKLFGTSVRASEPPDDPVARRNWIRARERAARTSS